MIDYKVNDQLIQKMMRKVFPQITDERGIMFTHNKKLILYRGTAKEGEFWVQLQKNNTIWADKIIKETFHLADPDVVNKLEHLKTLAES